MFTVVVAEKTLGFFFNSSRLTSYKAYAFPPPDPESTFELVDYACSSTFVSITSSLDSSYSTSYLGGSSTTSSVFSSTYSI